MTAPGNPLTGLESLVERIVDVVQTDLADPVFMADLENFLKLIGDFLETQTGETSTTSPVASASVRPAPQYTPPAQPAEGVTYYDQSQTPGNARAQARAKRANPTVTNYGGGD